MTVLIQRDSFQVIRPSRTLDDHGWAEDQATTVVGTVAGTLQEVAPADDPRATEGGGYGPADPAHRRLGTAYLTAEVFPGDLLETRGRTWRVQSARLVEDPRPSGDLDCWVCELSEVSDVD
jgi:hypothetical protein